MILVCKPPSPNNKKQRTSALMISQNLMIKKLKCSLSKNIRQLSSNNCLKVILTSTNSLKLKEVKMKTRVVNKVLMQSS